jgi:uncharacterized protein
MRFARPCCSSCSAPSPNRSPVRVERVHFPSAGATLVGDLHLPTSSTGPVAAVVVGGAWRTVKEQMATGYARELAARGFASLAFDYRGWGESGGRPRSMEDPMAKAEDIVAAAAYLASRADVADVHALGVCASGAYTATAATQTCDIASVALVAPALPSRATVQAQLGGRPGIEALTRSARAAAERYEKTGRELLLPAVERNPLTTAPGADYYTSPERGAVPQWDNTFNPASWTHWLDYDAQAAAPLLTQPLLVVHSDAAASPESVREFVALVPGRVEQLWLSDVSQFDFYDAREPMTAAADAVAAHVGAHRRALRRS